MGEALTYGMAIKVTRMQYQIKQSLAIAPYLFSPLVEIYTSLNQHMNDISIAL